MYEGELAKFMPRYQTLLKRYAVLNNRAFLFYKDDIAFRAYSNKPTVVVPLAEVVSVTLKDNPIAIKSQTGAGPRQYENMYIIEMVLARSYSQISKNIINFHHTTGNGGRLGR